MKKEKKLISFVIPVYNEQEVIPELIKRTAQFIKKIPGYNFEVILVENGSYDKSFDLLMKNTKKIPEFKILQLSKNFGADGGIVAGLHHAKGDACVIMMADLQEPLEVVKKFIEKWEGGNEIVYGIVRKRTGSAVRNLSSVLFYKIINFLTKNMFPANASDFRLVDRKVYEAIKHMPEQNKYLRGLITWTGFKHTGVYFDRTKRFAGEPKSNFKTVLGVAMNGIFSFSYLPLRFVSFLGAALTSISFILIIIYLAIFIIRGREAPGIATVILLLLFLFGVLFFVLGIISEYLARIYDDTKHRPNFIVKRTVRL